MLCSDTSTTLYLDNVAQKSYPPLLHAIGVPALGWKTEPDTIEGFSGMLAEVLVYNHTLTTDELTRIDTYLKLKYGL